VWVGYKVVAYVMLEEKTERIIDTTRLSGHLSKARPPFKPGQRVSIPYPWLRSAKRIQRHH